MTIFHKEMRQGWVSLSVWTGLMVFMLAICVLIYPEVKSQMNDLADSFSQMGSFSEAFGMDQINLGKFQDYFFLEWSNIMGLLGAMFAALLGIHALSGEENGHTAEFLLTHPITRFQVVGEKLLSLVVQVTLLNLAVAALSWAMTAAIGETLETEKALLLFVSTWLMHLELTGICFGVSALLKRNRYAIGIGIGAAAYFLNILSKLEKNLEFLRYITPMGYCDSSSILSQGSLDAGYLATGMGLLVLFPALAFWYYSRKDIS